ncbi:MAG: CinA family protein [Planctomycetota bacterium]
MVDAYSVVQQLVDGKHRIVLAESCTAGAIAAELGSVPGVSSVLLGSAVVYHPDLKSDWLGVDKETIEKLTAESAPVAHQLVSGIMQKTPMATLGLAITGHLGPGALPEVDGVVYIGTAARDRDDLKINVHANQLAKPKRIGRRNEAVQIALRLISEMVG